MKLNPLFDIQCKLYLLVLLWIDIHGIQMNQFTQLVLVWMDEIYAIIV